MARKMTLTPEEWLNEKNRPDFTEKLESGDILFFPTIPFAFPQDEIQFLLSQKQKYFGKNISYQSEGKQIVNHNSLDKNHSQEMLRVLSSYSNRVADFLQTLFPTYAKKWKLDTTDLQLFQKQPDCLHIDSSAKRPLHGNRVLRFFTNINPHTPSNWITSDSFEKLVERFGGEKGVCYPNSYENSLKDRLTRKMKHVASKTGIRFPIRSPYDVFMLKMDNFLKTNKEFQNNCHKDCWEFPPNSSWLVFTDQVAHARMVNPYTIEQSIIVPKTSLVFPDRSPVNVLERLSHRNMVDLMAIKGSFSD